MMVTLEWCRSFLCLVPDEAKSSYHVEGTGYDTYLRDAHRQVRLVRTEIFRTAAWRASAESGRKISGEPQRTVVVVSWHTVELWFVLYSSGIIAASASGGTGGANPGPSRSATWNCRSSRATSSRFSLTGWAASSIRCVWFADSSTGCLKLKVKIEG